MVHLAFALLAFALPSDRRRPRVVLAGGIAQAVAVVVAMGQEHVSGFNDWLLLDARGKLVLALTSALFFVCSLYVPPI